MEYIGLKPIEGVNGKEPTAFTLKTIKELLAEEAAQGDERAANAAELLESSAKPEPAPKPTLQRPPHMERATPAPVPTPPAPVAAAPKEPVAEAKVEKPEQPRSFLKRLIGG